MLQTEFIRSIHCNYERILLDKKPEEKRYQYCILSRGGIKGLLPCSLRYLNGLAYLYYDITSKQNITQLYGHRCITRQWLKDFVWGLNQIQTELGRFLLDERNILWYPEQIFQDLESNVFSFLYIPYYEGGSSFLKLLEYLVDHVDYEDETLVECVYRMYEQCEHMGEVYLQGQIFEDAKVLDVKYEEASGKEREKTEIYAAASDFNAEAERVEMSLSEKSDAEKVRVKDEKAGIRSFWDGKRRKNKYAREQYRQKMQTEMEEYKVAEETVYQDFRETEQEEYGRTVYIEIPTDKKELVRKLYTMDGRVVTQLVRDTYLIGKKKADVDLVLDDFSVSRIHARISRSENSTFLEDLNSTNGTFKNGIRLQPYEKRELEEGDEIKIGKLCFVYR